LDTTAPRTEFIQAAGRGKSSGQAKGREGWVDIQYDHFNLISLRILAEKTKQNRIKKNRTEQNRTNEASS